MVAKMMFKTHMSHIALLLLGLAAIAAPHATSNGHDVHANERRRAPIKEIEIDDNGNRRQLEASGEPPVHTCGGGPPQPTAKELFDTHSTLNYDHSQQWHHRRLETFQPIRVTPIFWQDSDPSLYPCKRRLC